MPRTHLLILTACLLFGCSDDCAPPPGEVVDPGPPPNIVFILSDDHTRAAISAYGSKLIDTPNLDRIAKEGVLFQNCCVTNSICAPSRAVILTGKHSHKNGVRTNRDRFDAAQATFPRMLQEAGYETALIGKWHLKTTPTGFDHWEVLPGQGAYYNPHFKTKDGRIKRKGYATDLITDLSIDWLKKREDKKKPFMLLSWHKAPHRNWQPPKRHLDTFDDVDLPSPPRCSTTTPRGVPPRARRR